MTTDAQQEDVEMIDIEDVQLAQSIATDLSQKRTNHKEWKRDNEFDNIRQVLPRDFEGIFMVDTNFVISHLSIVQGLVNAYIDSHMLVLIPWIVIQELDGLKNASTSHGQANLAGLARNAIRWIHECLATQKIGLRGQRMTESLESDQYGDDAILDCARYWQERQEIQPILMSNDINLCNKALIHGIPKITFEVGLNASKILDKVVGKSIETKHDRMDLDEVEKHISHASAKSTEIDPVSTTTEMDTDAIVAGYYDPKNAQDDPFEALSRKAGKSQYESASRSPSPATRRGRRMSIADRSRNASAGSANSRRSPASPSNVSRLRSFPEAPAISATKSSPEELKALLRDLERTMIEALPALMRAHLLRELKDEADVEFLMQGVTTLFAITQALYNNWFMCYNKVLAKVTTKEQLKALSNDLHRLQASKMPQHVKVLEVLQGWCSLWKGLSCGVQRGSYAARRDEQIAVWRGLLA